MKNNEIFFQSVKEGYINLREAKRQLAAFVKNGKFTLFNHGTLSLEIYAPPERSQPLPHLQDEIYFVIQGSGEYICGAERQKLQPSDFMFVPAGKKHKLASLTADFLVWRILFGPEGGKERKGGLLCLLELIGH